MDNLFAVLLGNKSALTGGSGKVVDSGPNDNIFIYYADHGAPGLVGKHWLICLITLELEIFIFSYLKNLKYMTLFVQPHLFYQWKD